MLRQSISFNRRNGDEVRHSDWNAIMVKELDGKRGEFLGFRELKFGLLIGRIFKIF